MSIGTVQQPSDVRRRRGSAMLWCGVLLLVAGLSVLGWLGWQIWGTTWQSHRIQHRVIDSLQQQWRHGHDVAADPDGSGDLPDALAIVRIPRFGADYAMPVLEGTSDDALAAGLGHYGGTAPPGGVGNFALAGHRITHGEPLRDMPSLRPGDRVVVTTRTRVFTYQLDTGGDDLDVPDTATWVIDPVPTNPQGGVEPPDRSPGQRLLTLTTCAELFHTEDRLVAFGHLVAVRGRATVP